MNIERNQDIEVQVNFEQSSAPVKFRFLDDFTGEGWQSTPWQSADVDNLNPKQVLEKVSQWVDSQ